MKIELRQIEARHPAATRGAASALRGLSLDIARGEQLAVIGPSGAGKTTLLQVAAVALKPRSGKVALDGTDPWMQPVRALQRLRGHLFLAPQTPPLPPRQRVITAVLAARLPALSLAASLRSLFYPIDIEGAHAALERFGLADKLFERVDRLSGGERQRVGLARALLANPRLLVLDEATSALDGRTEAAIQATLRKVRAGRTTLVVAHRLSTIADADQILVIRRGRIVERGDHAALLAREGEYAALWRRQTRAEGAAPTPRRSAPAAAE